MKVNHLLIPYIAALVFIFGSILGSDGVLWYRTLVLPSWAPTEGFVAFVWAAIYVLISWSALIIWNQDHRDRRFKTMMALFTLAGLANLAWSGLFFGFHAIYLSVGAALLLAILLMMLAVLAAKRSKKAALLVVPFIVWVLFAAYFTSVLATLNP